MAHLVDGSIRVAVLGASGFSGGELIRLLHDHPRFEVTFAGAKGSAGMTVGASHPHLAGLPAAGLVMAEASSQFGLLPLIIVAVSTVFVWGTSWSPLWVLAGGGMLGLVLLR